MSATTGTAVQHPEWCDLTQCDIKEFSSDSFTHWATLGEMNRAGGKTQLLAYQCVGGEPKEPGIYLVGADEELTLFELDDLIDMLTVARRRAADIVPAK